MKFAIEVLVSDEYAENELVSEILFIIARAYLLINSFDPYL